jgi:hypothetical protein
MSTFDFPLCPECGKHGPVQNDIVDTKYCKNENCNIWFYWNNGGVHHKGKNTKEIWPNFFIVGAQKSGTTSMYNYLRLHPKIFLSPIKEPAYFSKFRGSVPFKTKSPTKEQYLELFQNANDKPIIGEVSTPYLFDQDSASSIYKTIPDAKIIIILRDPIERAYSRYLENRWDSNLPSFGEEIRKGIDVLNKQYLDPADNILFCGLYYKQVKRYIETFGEKNVKIFIYEEIFPNNIKEKVKEILEFLGTTEFHDFEETNYFGYYTPRGKTFLSNTLVKKFAYTFVPENLRIFLYKKIRNKDNKKPKMNTEDRTFLHQFYFDDVSKLQCLLKRQLPWSILRI